MLVFLEHPGLLFVAATLLPLASFVVLLLSFGIKSYFRRSPEGSTGHALFQLFGGSRPSRVPAYVATGAIGTAFVLCLTGFIAFLSDHAEHEANVLKLEEEVAKKRDSRHHRGEHYEEATAEVDKLRGKIKAAQATKSKDDVKKLEQELHTALKKQAEAGNARDEQTKELNQDIKTLENKLAKLKGHWAGKMTWVAVHPSSRDMEELQGEIEALKKKLPPSQKADAKDKEKVKKSAMEAWELQQIEREIRDNEAELAELRKHQPATLLALGFRIDMLSALMFVMVTLIATLIHIFSMGYMADELEEQVADHQVHTAEGHLHRRGRFGHFFLYLSLFCFSMLNLILADNLFQVFLSWELVGICSYLLIGFYFERTSASNAANKAFITNRVGDAGFIIGLLILWTYVGTFNFEEIFQRIRAPMVHSHGQVQLAGQIVRVRPESGKEHEFAIVAPSEPVSADMRAVLFPLEFGDHIDNYRPGKVLTIGGPDVEHHDTPYGSIPYWMLVAAGLGIFLGCVGKSAQFPLQVWLPDAMEGPTPVSALIHAATMVAAGVYLVGRVYPLFTLEALLVIAYTGAITLFVAATIALVMTDIKKVLAYSTVSQLGFMMMALGVGGWAAGLFHLITHAFFKALLFLGSGSVIHGCHHEQEMTKMGGLYPKMKITAITMLAGVLAISGVPLFSGWYSKDAMLAQAMGFAMVHKQHFLLFILPTLTAGLTTFYMFRMWFMTFTGKPRDHQVHEHAHESPWLMTVPLIVLAFFSFTVSWGLHPLHEDSGWFWDPEGSWLEQQIHHAQPDAVMADFGVNWTRDKRWNPLKVDDATGTMGVHDLTWRGPNRDEYASVRYQTHKNEKIAGLIVLGVSVLSFVLAACVYYFKLLDPADAMEQFPGVYNFLTNKWYFDAAYSVLLVRPAMTVARWCRIFDNKVIDGVVDGSAKVTVQVSRGSGRFDNGVIDGLVNVIANACYATGSWLRNVQTGYLRSYVIFLVLAAVGIWVILSSLLGAR